MTTQQFFLSGWDWDPFALAVGAAMVAGGAIADCGLRIADFKRGPPAGVVKRMGFLVIAALIFLIAAVSPISVLANGYLFSAHMMQHMLLLLLVPPFLLLSLPAVASAPTPGRSVWRMVERALTWPGLAWLAGVGAMWLWHAPALCNAATASQPVHRFQIVSLLLLGTLFWWPIVGPRTERRLMPLVGILYLFTACFACTVLGIFITFAPISVCPVYLHPMDRLGLLPLIRGDWGFTPTVDQQVGGLLMWVPACLVYLSAIMGLLARWYGSDEGEVAAAPAEAGPGLAPSDPVPENS